MTTSLQFNEERHEYTLAGRRVPSVTSVIRSHVKGWQASEWHMARGSMVHLAVRLALEGKLDWDSVDERIANRVKSILKFLTDVKLKHVAVELRLASQIHQFAGCLDYVGEDESNGLTIADWKSTFEPSAEVQIGLYSELWFAKTKREASRGVIVECQDSGGYKCNWMTKQELRNAARVGIAMLTVHGWKDRHGLNKKETE